MKIVLATKNQGKLREFKELCRGLPVEFLTLDAFPRLGELAEDGATFRDNALQKAHQVTEATGYPAMADDSGLEVKALGGEPGVYSARYAGPEKDDRKNNQLLLEKMKDVPEGERQARFVCAIALTLPDGREYVTEGTCSGRIAFAPQGDKGFGYDPLFIVEKFGQTFGELDEVFKNTVSHRAKAAKQMVGIISRVHKELTEWRQGK